MSIDGYDPDLWDDEDEDGPDDRFLFANDHQQALNITVKKRIGMAWNVTFRVGRISRTIQVCDAGLPAVCAWAADRADDARLIVTPLP